MQLHKFLIVGLILFLSACAEKEQPVSAEGEGQQGVGADPAPAPAENQPDKKGSAAFIRHMHAHARQLQRLNEALEADDLLAAQTPAYWLSRHEGVSGPVDSWQPYIEQMRDAARAVTNAPDVEAARVAARRIADGCRGCHAIEGVEVPGLGSG